MGVRSSVLLREWGFLWGTMRKGVGSFWGGKKKKPWVYLEVIKDVKLFKQLMPWRKGWFFYMISSFGKGNWLAPHSNSWIMAAWLKVTHEFEKVCHLSVQFSCSVMSDSLQPLQHARLPCPSPTPGAYSNSCPSWRCHPTISSSVIPFSSCLPSFPASGSFPMSQFFSSGGQSFGASVSVLPMSIQEWFPVGLIGWISLQS